MKTTLKITFVLLFVFISNCDNNECLVCRTPTVDELEAIVKGNCVTLLEAVETFTEENDGFSPLSLESDTSLAGKALIDYLPYGERLLNPFTGLKDQPTDTIPSAPGEIGYYKRYYYSNVFYIRGYGNDGIIFEEDNIAETEAIVIENCLTLQDALILWHQDNNGFYPCSSLEENIEGKTVFDYLPDGLLMLNPFTGYRTEPIFASAATSGQVGYVCVVEGGNNTGYVITGVGVTNGETIITLACY